MGFGRLLLDSSSKAADSNTRVRPHYARGRRGFRFLPGFFRAAIASGLVTVILRTFSAPLPKRVVLNAFARRMRLVDLQLMVFFYPRRAENRTFRPPVTQKQKNILNFKKRLKIVEISHTSRPWSQPQRHALPLPVSNEALGGFFAPCYLLFGRRHLEARRKIALIGSKPLLVLIGHSSRCRDGASTPW